MIQVNLTVDYDGKLYNTNVITTSDTTDEEILEIAISQIEQQWKE
ncbi:BA3454 family stress response protein [Oceanobacillus sp. FSL K6-2867]